MEVPNQNEWTAAMNGLTCLLMSHRNPSNVSNVINRLTSIVACSNGPGLGILVESNEACCAA